MNGNVSKVGAYFHEDALMPSIEKTAKKFANAAEHTKFDAPIEGVVKEAELAKSEVHLAPYLVDRPDVIEALKAAKAADPSIYIG